MLKSIFAKYITAVTVIVLVSFCILASIIYSIITNDFIDRKMTDVEHSARLAADVTSYGFESGHYDSITEYFLTHPDIGYAINSLTHEDSGICLFVTDWSGDLLLTSESFCEDAERIVADSAFWQELLTELEENGLYRRSRSLKSLGEGTHIICAVNIYDESNQVIGIAFACASSFSAVSLVSTTVQAVILACLWIMLAMLIAMYILTERIVDPIKRMSLASKNYAKGKFDTRIEVLGHDEVAELSVAFNHMADELDLLEKKRNQFISDVSHELRSPMMAILGFVEGIRSGSVPEDQRDYYLGVTADEIQRLSRLVANLLDVSRLEMGDKKLNFVKCDICDKAFFVLVSLEKRIEEKRLEVEFDAKEDNLFVRADDDALHRVLYNLCENAVKFSHEGAKLKIGIYENRSKDVVLEVYNEGIGISAEDLPYIFERFYKSDKSRGQDKKGVGLGLYFVKTIVTAHDGEITAESEEGKYCRFILKFPRYQDK